jgi:hypothetical protein
MGNPVATRDRKPEQKAPKKKPQARIFSDNVNLSLSAGNAVLSVDFGDKTELTVMMPTVEVDKFIETLWKFRAEMKPERPRDFALGQKVYAIRDPRWCTESELMRGGSLIHLRHPGLGWLSFWIPKPDAAKLGGCLLAQVEEQEQHPPEQPR